MFTDTDSILSAAARMGMTHNNGAGGEFILVGTERQLLDFATTVSSLEGIKKALLNPGPVQRCSQGYWSNPLLPGCDEDVRYDVLLSAFDLELECVWAESQVSIELADKMVEEADCSEWTPEPPTGDGWVLASVHNTEDGDVAWFVRPRVKTPEATKRERMKRADSIVDRLMAMAGAFAKAEAAIGMRGELKLQALAALNAKRELAHALQSVAWIASAAETGLEALLAPDPRFEPPAWDGKSRIPEGRPFDDGSEA